MCEVEASTNGYVKLHCHQSRTNKWKRLVNVIHLVCFHLRGAHCFSYDQCLYKTWTMFIWYQYRTCTYRLAMCLCWSYTRSKLHWYGWNRFGSITKLHSYALHLHHFFVQVLILLVWLWDQLGSKLALLFCMFKKICIR